MKKIKYSAFENCTSLTSISLPSGVTEIGHDAFNGCDLKSIVSYIENPDKCVWATDKNVFKGTTLLESTLYVPAGTVDAYRAAYNWKEFVNIREIGQQDIFTLGIYGNEGGEISFLDKTISNQGANVSVCKNQSVTLAFTPYDEYYIDNVLVNGVDITEDLYNNTYTIAQIKENTTVNVKFSKNPVFLTIKYADNGCVEQKVELGEIYEYKISPAVGWEINTITFNEIDVTSHLTYDYIYTTPEIETNSTLNISFEECNTSMDHKVINDIKIYTDKGLLVVKNAPVGEYVYIYGQDGGMIEKNIVTGNIMKISLAPHNIYIIKVGDRTFKIAI